MKKTVFMLVFSCVLLLTITACKEEQPIVAPINLEAIKGQFVGADNVPLSNVTVEAIDAEGKVFSTSTTDAEGNFEIQNIPSKLEDAIVSFINDTKVLQQLTLSTVVKLASEENSATGSKKVTIFQGGDYDNLSLSITIFDIETKELVEGATVRVVSPGSAMLEATTNSEGIAEFDEAIPGRFIIRVLKDGYLEHKEGVYLSDEIDNFEYQIGIRPDVTCNDNTITAKVLNGDVPVANQKVFIDANTYAFTNDQGIATFENVTTGNYSVCTEITTANGSIHKACDSIHVWCQDTEIAEIQIASASQDPQDPTDPQICCDNTISVTTVNATDNTPRVGESIALHNIHTGELITIVTTDNAGIARFENVCTGDYRASVAQNSKFRTDIWKVACQTTSEATLAIRDETPVDTMCCNSTLIINFTTNNGNPIGEGAEVTTYRQLPDGTYNVYGAIQETNGNSHITFNGNCPGKVTYLVKVKKTDASGNITEYESATFEVEFECDSYRSKTIELIPQ